MYNIINRFDIETAFLPLHKLIMFSNTLEDVFVFLLGMFRGGKTTSGMARPCRIRGCIFDPVRPGVHRMTAKPPTDADGTDNERSDDEVTEFGDPIQKDRTRDLFDVLSHRRRRYVLSLLRDHRSLTIADLADCIAEIEQDCPITEIPADEVLYVYISLYHNHLPKLSDAGLIRYNREREIVGPAFREHQEVGRLLDQFTRPVSRYDRL